jgi:heme exporter protein A
MKSNSLCLNGLVVAREMANLTPPITLTIHGGQLLALHGSNGSGKSTLLKTIAGLLPIQQGSITYNEAWPIEPRPVYFGHKRGLSPSMSVIDNVAFWAKASGHPELIDAAMHYFDLTDIPDARVDSLSAGWQQRVALTRLITMPSGLWLLDEPTSNLDSDGISLLHSLMQTRLEQGGIILVATHMQLEGENIIKLNISELESEAHVEALC